MQQDSPEIALVVEAECVRLHEGRQEADGNTRDDDADASSHSLCAPLLNGGFIGPMKESAA